MILITKIKIATIVVFLSISAFFVLYQVAFHGVFYSPLGGVYINVTDCQKPYTGGQGSFGGPETRYSKTLTKVPDANWYVDDVDTIAKSLWRVDSRIYDDAFLELKKAAYSQTNRIINDIDEAELTLLFDDYYGDVGFTDTDTTYVVHGRGWGSIASINRAGCYGYGSMLPTDLSLPGEEPTPKKELLDLIGIEMIELQEPFAKRGSASLNGYSSDYLLVNDTLYYQMETTSRVVKLGRVASDSEIIRLYPKSGGSISGDIISVGGKIFAGDKEIAGDPAEFSLVVIGEKAGGHIAYSDDFVVIGDDVYFVDRELYSALELEKTDADAENFQLYTGEIFTKQTVYTDGVNYYIVGRGQYRIVSVAEVDNNPGWGTVEYWLKNRTI